MGHILRVSKLASQFLSNSAYGVEASICTLLLNPANIESEPRRFVSTSLPSGMFAHFKSAAMEAFQASPNAMRMWFIKNAVWFYCT